MSRAIRPALAVLGLLIMAASVVWWWRTFGQVVGFGYLSWPEAGRCLVSDSDLCTLAKTLCLSSHPRLVLTYGTSAFWSGAAILSLSLCLSRSRAVNATGDRR